MTNSLIWGSQNEISLKALSNRIFKGILYKTILTNSVPDIIYSLEVPLEESNNINLNSSLSFVHFESINRDNFLIAGQFEWQYIYRNPDP